MKNRGSEEDVRRKETGERRRDGKNEHRAKDKAEWRADVKAQSAPMALRG